MTRGWRKTTALAFLLLGLMAPSVVAAAPPSGASIPLTAGEPIRFDDLPEEHFAYWSVAHLREQGVVAMNAESLFRPDDPVRRAELLKMLLAARRIATGPEECQGLFADTPCGSWYAPAVETAYRVGILEGKAGGLAGPGDSLTRQELLTLAVRALGHRQQAARLSGAEADEILQPYPDQGELAPWARPSVALSVRAGMMEGARDGLLRPTDVATRAEAALVVERLLLEGGELPAAEVDGKAIPYRQALDMRASAYTAGEGGAGNHTAMGLPVRTGTVSVDPAVIPLGTLLYIEGYGYAIAADTGGAVQGNRIDLYFPTLESALAFGVRSTRVWVLP